MHQLTLHVLIQYWIPGGAVSFSSPNSNSHIDDDQTSESMGERENDSNNFINLETLGFRHGGRKITPSTSLRESDPRAKGMGTHRKKYGMLVVTLSDFVQTGQLFMDTGVKYISHCYQGRLMEYGDYLERKFDGKTIKQVH